MIESHNTLNDLPAATVEHAVASASLLRTSYKWYKFDMTEDELAAAQAELFDFAADASREGLVWVRSSRSTMISKPAASSTSPWVRWLSSLGMEFVPVPMGTHITHQRI